MTYFEALQIRGQVYDLAHLDPFTLMIDSQKVGRILKIRIRFTIHCYTESWDPVRHNADELVFLDEGKRQRVFCPIRYGLSNRLQRAITDLNHPKARVFQTGSGRNWMHSIPIDTDNGPYHIFFEVRRAPQDRKHLQDLELTVESAYPQSDSNAPLVRGQMGFFIVASKVYLGEPIATKR